MLEALKELATAVPYVKVKLYPGNVAGTIGMEVKAGATSVVVPASLDFTTSLDVIEMELTSLGLTKVLDEASRLHFALVRENRLQ